MAFIVRNGYPADMKRFELNEDQLKKYLSGDLSDEDQHAIEKQMADSDFVNDAVEGLQAFGPSKKLDDYVSQLNKNLSRQLESKKQHKEKRKIRDMQWIIIAVITILLLCVLAFVVVKMQREKQQEKIDRQNHILFNNTPGNNTTPLV